MSEWIEWKPGFFRLCLWKSVKVGRTVSHVLCNFWGSYIAWKRQKTPPFNRIVSYFVFFMVDFHLMSFLRRNVNKSKILFPASTLMLNYWNPEANVCFGKFTPARNCHLHPALWGWGCNGIVEMPIYNSLKSSVQHQPASSQSLQGALEIGDTNPIPLNAPQCNIHLCMVY